VHPGNQPAQALQSERERGRRGNTQANKKAGENLVWVRVADLLCWAGPGGKDDGGDLRVLRLQLRQFLEKRVILRVAQRRPAFGVVALVGIFDLASQAFHSATNIISNSTSIADGACHALPICGLPPLPVLLLVLLFLSLILSLLFLLGGGVALGGRHRLSSGPIAAAAAG